MKWSRRFLFDTERKLKPLGKVKQLFTQLSLFLAELLLLLLLFREDPRTHEWRLEERDPFLAFVVEAFTGVVFLSSWSTALLSTKVTVIDCMALISQVSVSAGMDGQEARNFISNY